MANDLGAYATYISGAGPTIMAVVNKEDELFFERAEAAMQEDEKMRAFALHRLLADNVGAVVE